MLKIPKIDSILEDNFSSIEKAFIHAPVWVMHSLKNVPDGYLPAEVRLGWNQGSLVLLATLPDIDVQTRATQDQQPLWELGDVFEIFVKRENQPGYHELHVSPNQHRLQLWFPARETLQELKNTSRGWEQQIVHNPLFELKTQIDAKNALWKVFVRLPWETVAGECSQMKDIWRLPCCRYDYRKDLDDPVLESTSPHTIVNYHLLDDWLFIQVDRSED